MTLKAGFVVPVTLGFVGGVALRLAFGSSGPPSTQSPASVPETVTNPPAATRAHEQPRPRALAPAQPTWPPTNIEALDQRAAAAQAGDPRAVVELYAETVACANVAADAALVRMVDSLSEQALDRRNWKPGVTRAQADEALAQLARQQEQIKPRRERVARCAAVGPEQQVAAARLLARAAEAGDRGAMLCLLARSAEISRHFVAYPEALRTVRDYGARFASELFESGEWASVPLLARAHDPAIHAGMEWPEPIDARLLRQVEPQSAALAYRYYALALLGGLDGPDGTLGKRAASLKVQLTASEAESAERWAAVAKQRWFGGRGGDTSSIDACGPPPANVRETY